MLYTLKSIFVIILKILFGKFRDKFFFIFLIHKLDTRNKVINQLKYNLNNLYLGFLIFYLDFLNIKLCQKKNKLILFF